MESDYSFNIIQHNDPGWIEFISELPDVNIFHHPAWINFLASTYGYQPFIAVVQSENGRIAAGLPIMEIINFAGKRRWVSLPFTDYCTPLFRDKQSQEMLLENIIKKAGTDNKTSLELRWDFQSPLLYQATPYVLTTTKLDLNQKRDFQVHPKFSKYSES